MSDTNNTENEDLKLDGKVPPQYFSQMQMYARNFDERNPTAAIEGVKMDSDVRWNFDHSGLTHFDNSESIFVARNLEFMRAGIYAKRYPQLKWNQFVPANYSIDTGAGSYTVTTSDTVGGVTVARMPSNQVLNVSAKVGQSSQGFFSMTNGYEFNLQEVRQAIFERKPLPTILAMGARNVMERKLDDVALLGESTMQIKGLFNLSGTATYAIPATGAGGLTSWESKSSDDILADLNGPIDQMMIATNEIETPDTMIIAVSRKRLILNKRVGDGTSSTVYRYFTENQDIIKDIKTSYKLESNAGWTGKRGVLYQNNEECLELLIPQAFEQMAPVAMHMTVSTICHMRTGGVALHKPQAVSYFDGT